MKPSSGNFSPVEFPLEAGADGLATAAEELALPFAEEEVLWVPEQLFMVLERRASIRLWAAGSESWAAAKIARALRVSVVIEEKDRMIAGGVRFAFS